MQQQNITAIQSQHRTIDWFSNLQNSSKSFDSSMGKLYPYRWPEYIQTQT